MDSSTPLKLPLKPHKTKTAQKDNLPIRIAQINAQRGSFRNISEQSLQDELQSQKQKSKNKNKLGAEEDTVDENEKDGDNKTAQEVDATEHQEQLYKKRAEIIQFAA